MIPTSRQDARLRARPGRPKEAAEPGLHDPKRIAAEGFSDGASYALSIGITNGDLFSHVIAFSPGFMAPREPWGKPEIYVSHGTKDQVLPIDSCSRRLVPRLRGAGYDVKYREFDGPHTVPEDVAREAVEWFTE